MSDMIPCSEAASVLVTLRGRFVAAVVVVHRLLDLEARGCHFELVDGGQKFRVGPVHRLTADDVTFLRAHRDEARAVIAYQADASHLLYEADIGF